MHDLSFSSEITQRFLFVQDSDDLGQEFGNGDGSYLFILNKKRDTSMVCWIELVMMSSLIGS